VKKVQEAIWKELLPVSSAFTTAEVAEAADVHLANASRDLAKMADRGLVSRVRRGLWVAPNHPEFSPYAVVPSLFRTDDEAYVSVVSALNLHGMIDQIPSMVHVVTRGQRHRLSTPFATYEFHSLQDALFGGFEPYSRTGAFMLALPEKALFDTLYFSTRRGRRFVHLPEVELNPEFSRKELSRWISRIAHRSLRNAVRGRWEELQGRLAAA